MTDLRRQLLAHLQVADCAVLSRVDRDGAVIVVAYVIPTGAVSLDELRAFAREGGCDVLPDVVIRVSSIPLTDDGQIDEPALTALPVVDADVLAQYRASLRAVPGLADADVSVEWNTPVEVMLRVDDLVPRAAPALSKPARAAARKTVDPNARPSMSIGEPIVQDASTPRTLSDLLARAASEHGANGVICLEQGSEHSVSYSELRTQAERIMAGLRSAGVRPRDIVIFEIDRNAEFVAAFWGCVLGGFVPAPISVPVIADPTSAAATKLKNAWELLGRPVVVTTAAVAASLASMRDALDMRDMQTLTVERLLEAPAGEAWHEPSPDDLALLLLTSGSTGRPKAVTQTHGALVAYVAGIAQRHQFDANDVSLNWFPLDHVGGIVMFHLRDVALGCRQIHARTDYILQDALRWLDLIDRFRVTITWAPNFAYALVNDRAQEVAARTWDLSSLTFILNAGEAIVAQTTRRFIKLLRPHGLPAIAMRPSWGMSETCSAETFAEPFSLDTTSDTDEFVEVGTPNPGFDIRIVNDEHHVVPEGAEGHLEVRGPCVTKGYLNNPEVNATSFAADGWFRTGDLGRLVNGSLTITGREKGEIIVNGVNYPAHEVEAAVEDVADVTASFAAAFAVRETGDDTDALAVAFHTPRRGDTELSELLRRIRQTVLERVGVYPRFLLLVEQSEIPKTAIGKIQRSALTKRFAAGGFADAVRRSEQLTKRAETIPAWFYRPVWRRRAIAGGQSLDEGTVMLIVDGGSGIDPQITTAARASGARVVVADSNGFASAVATVSAEARLIVVIAARENGDENEAAAALAAAQRMAAVIGSIARSRGETATTELLVYDRGAQHVTSGDRAPIGRASILGLLRSVSAEHPGIAVRHVDLATDGEGARGQWFIDELADRGDEPEVAYRNGVRWVRRLMSVAPSPRSEASVLSRTDGFHLVTGGLGGIGVEVCRHLLRTPGMRVLVVGRQPIESIDAGRAASLAALQALGDVRYAVADVADSLALERAVTEASTAWSSGLASVVHLAGVFTPRLIADETPETLADALRAKVTGGWNVHQLLRQYPNAALIAFSSVNGQLGGYTAAAYATANAFLDGLVAHHVEELGRRAYSLGWTLWNDVGMSRDYALKESAARRGYHAIDAHQGVISFAAAVASEPGQLLIGLDGTNPHARRFVTDGPLADRIRVERSVKASGTELPGSLADRFSTPVPVTVREATDDHDVSGNGPSTGSDIERIIASVWCDVLAAGRIAPNENFFDAGGTSLLVATASRKLQDALGRPVAMTDIYRFPTLRLLATHYAGDGAGDAAELDESEERGKARRAQRAERRRRTT